MCLLEGLGFIRRLVEDHTFEKRSSKYAAEHALNTHFGNLTCRPTSYAAQKLPPNSLDAPRR